MKNFAIVIGLLASVNSFAGVIYSNTADLSNSTFGHKIADAKIFHVASKVEYRDIPGCDANGEISQICTETVVLERTPVLQVNVSYSDAMGQLEGSEKNWLTLNLAASDAGKTLSLSVVRAERTIQVVDVLNSTLCDLGEAGAAAPGCSENIVYKSAKTTVKAVTVSAK